MAQEQVELYDIYGMWHVPFWQTAFFYYIVGGCGILLCGIAFYYCYRWYKRRTKKVPYWLVSQRALDELSGSSLNTVNCADLFYSRLLVILKQHLSAHFNHDFIGATDQECIQMLRRIGEKGPLGDTVKEITERTETIRFARDTALKEGMQTDLQKIYSIVQTVRRQSPVEKKSGT